MIKGMQEWVEYIARQLNMTCEVTPWASRYTLPPENGQGYMECCEEAGQWVVWRCDFVVNKGMRTAYMQEDPYYIAFSWRETNYVDNYQYTAWPSDEIIEFESRPGMGMRGVGVYLFPPFYERLADKDIMDFVQTMQSYNDEVLMKQITPVLRQMYGCTASGLALRFFMESRVLEIASILVEVDRRERYCGKVVLSAFDAGQLHKALEILEQRMTNPPTISELARLVALNENKLKAGFRQLFGTTVYEHLRLLRMEKAADFLRDGQLSAAQVGRQVGYQTPHGFTGAFRRYYGMAPAQWQKMNDSIKNDLRK